MLPYLTGEFSGVGGTIKNRAEDFFVQEIPLYEPSGEGEHVYCEIQKTGLTTFDAIDRIADALSVSSRDIGYAGLKDARAVTRQILSIWGTDEEAVTKLKIPDLTVLWVNRHINKMRLGHLAGNRFAVKIRDVSPTDVVRVKPMLELLQHRGMPNYFGEQRFGRRGDNDRLGAAFVRGDDRTLLHHLLGNPNPAIDDNYSRRAREAFDRGELDAAMKAWPRRSGMERRILHRLIKTKRPAAATRAVDQKLRRLWISALQSRVFNDVLARRIATIDRVETGDLAYKHDHGACFLVQDAAAEQPRAESFEISPTGPLVGYRMSLPEGEPLRHEQEALAAAHLSPADFRRTHVIKVKGARRPLRVQPKDVEVAGGVDTHGPHITVAFTLPAGSFATVLLGELMKTAPKATDSSQAERETEGPQSPVEANDSEDPEDGEDTSDSSEHDATPLTEDL